MKKEYLSAIAARIKIDMEIQQERIHQLKVQLKEAEEIFHTLDGDDWIIHNLLHNFDHNVRLGVFNND